jgi:hypothetical protein
MFAPLMILLEIDAAGLAILEFEGDAPWSINVRRITLRIESLQGMKVETRNVHFLGSDSDIKTVEPCENALMHLRIDLRTLAPGPKLRKGFASQGSDHKPT